MLISFVAKDIKIILILVEHSKDKMDIILIFIIISIKSG